jgi:hypothetical protein
MSGTVYQDFEQKVKLLGDWLVFLKAKEREYQTQLDRARRAGTTTETSAVQDEGEQAMASSSFLTAEEERQLTPPTAGAEIAEVEVKEDRWI